MTSNQTAQIFPETGVHEKAAIDWARWLLPSYLSLVFLLHPVATLLRPDMMLADPGTGWHLRAGHLTLDSLAQGKGVLTTDPFSFSQPSPAWVSYQWLWQAAVAVLDRWGGIPLVTAACSLAFAVVPALICARLMAQGVTPVICLGTTLLAYGVLLTHALNRPHIATYIFFALQFHMLRDLYDRPGAWARVMVVSAAMMVVWVNMHPAFLLGIGLPMAFAGVCLAQGRTGPSVRYGQIAGACAVASLVNPRLWDLHLYVFRYLRAKSTEWWIEYRSPDFFGGGSSVVAFGVMAGLLFWVVGWARGPFVALVRGRDGQAVLERIPRRQGNQGRFLDMVLAGGFLLMGLTAIRHMTLFAIVGADFLGRELARFLRGRPEAWAREIEAVGDLQPWLKSHRILIPAVCVGVLWLSLSPISGRVYRQGLHTYLSPGAAAFLRENPERTARLWNPVVLGGELAYNLWPRKIFADDRNDYYGDKFFFEEYFPLADATGEVRRAMDRWKFDAAIFCVREPKMGLQRYLVDCLGWEEAYKDDTTLILAPPLLRTAAH